MGHDDISKRGKMLGLSFGITLGVFLLKILQTEPYELYQMYLIAIGAFVLTFVGLLWVLGFVVNKRALTFFIPQSAILVFSEVLFIQLFFFAKFDRVYEAVLLIVILVILFVSSYASFLMANVFTVSSFKVIPLEQVAKTTSYILSLLMTYFLTFVVLSSEFHIAITLILITVVGFLVSILHIVHLRFSRRLFRLSILITVLNIFICAVASILIGNRYEIIAVAPTIAMFVSVAIVLNSEESRLKWYNLVEYILFIVAAFLINILAF